MMHASINPEVINDKCNGDGACLHHCSVHCITLQEGIAAINGELCIGCGECITDSSAETPLFSRLKAGIRLYYIELYSIRKLYRDILI